MIRIYILSMILSFILGINGYGQKSPNRPFGGQTINIRVLNLQLYYEYGEASINHWGFNGAIGIYKNLFIGGYRQWGQHTFSGANQEAQSDYRRGGVLLGYHSPSGIKKLNFLPIVQLGWGRIKSNQQLPIIYENVKEKFRVISPELGLQYQLNSILSLTTSGGYHFYTKKNKVDLPNGFESVNLNDYYLKIGIKLGV